MLYHGKLNVKKALARPEELFCTCGFNDTVQEAGKLCVVILVKKHMDSKLTTEFFLLCGQEQGEIWYEIRSWTSSIQMFTVKQEENHLSLWSLSLVSMIDCKITEEKENWKS